MTESANLFKEVKLVTRSLLLSAPNGLSVRDFVSDYRKHNGQAFPYRELGYNSAADLLMDLRDAVYMVWMPHIGDYLLKGIADESTKHIENLVKKQRKHKSSGLRKTPPRFRKLNRDPFRYHNDSTGHLRNGDSYSMLKRVTKQHLSGAVPVKTRSQIRQLMASFEDGLLSSNFEIAFKKQFGTDFPFANLGFSSLEDCLRRIPDVVLQGSGNLLKVYSARKKHNEELGRCLNSGTSVRELKECSKKPTVNGLDTKNTALNCMDQLDGFDSPESQNRYNRNHENFISSTCGSTLSASAKCDKVNGLSSEVGNSYFSENQKKVENKSRLYCDSKGNSLSLTNNCDTLEYSERSESGSDEDDIAALSALNNLSTDDGISEKMKRDFRRVLEIYPEGIWATEFLEKYTEVTRQSLDISELGYFSLIEMASVLPDIFVISRPHNRKDDWLLLNANNVKHTEKDGASASPKPLITREEEFEISETLKENVVNILKHCCQNVPLEEFEKIYKVHFNQDIPWAELGFDSIEAFMVVLSGDIALNLSNVNGKLYVTLPTKSLRYLETPSMFMDLKSKSTTIPSDAAMSDCHFQQQSLPEDLSHYVGVFVATVVHPGQIWIQIRGETTTNALEVLMTNLEKVYYGNGDDYKMPTSFVEVGLVCAVVWPGDENWHRAVVTGIPNKEFAEVFYVDYGSKGNVEKSNLRFLKKEFLYLPAQALKARLANIVPAIGKRWSARSGQVLLTLCENRPLAALIINTEYEERLSVCLCDVSQETDFHINDFLVREGYARVAKDPYCVEEDMNDLVSTSPVNQTPQGNVDDVAPTLPNCNALTGVMNLAAVHLLSQLSSSGINMNSLSHLLSTLDLSSRASPHVENSLTSPPSDSAGQHKRSCTEEHREIFEEGDEFYEQLCQSAEELKVSVKRKCLTGGQVIHIINSSQKPFVSSGDVSFLFGKSVCLEKLLSMKKILIPSVTLESTDNKDIFDELKRYNVKGIKNEGGVEKVILYPLMSVTEILDGLSHPSNVLRKDVANIIIEVNDYEDFWQEDGDKNETYLNSQNMDLESMSIEELSALYKEYFDRRNIIIQKMTSLLGPKDDYVEELHSIENNLSKIEAKLKQMAISRENAPEIKCMVFQGTSTVPKIPVFEQISVGHNQNTLSWKTSLPSHFEVHHHSSNALPKRNASSLQETSDTSTASSQEMLSKDSQVLKDEASASVTQFHLQKSPLQYISKDNECNYLVKAIPTVSLPKDICTLEQKVPCCYFEQTAVRNTPVTQGRIFFVPSKPPIRFSSEIFASRNSSSPSLFPVRPTAPPPMYGWGGSQSTL